MVIGPNSENLQPAKRSTPVEFRGMRKCSNCTYLSQIALGLKKKKAMVKLHSESKEVFAKNDHAFEDVYKILISFACTYCTWLKPIQVTDMIFFF